jgi:DNA-binding MarR family transcriptional regulator
MTRHCQYRNDPDGWKMMRRARAESRRHGKRDELLEIVALCDENVLFYLRMSALAAKIHGKGSLSGPRRTILVSLAESGPRTVAQMARDRAQARQRIQPIVNSLIDEGLLQPVPNAAHKQSPLIVVTPRGRKEVERIHRLEQAWRSRAKFGLSKEKVTEAIEVLRTVRLEMERLLHDK